MSRFERWLAHRLGWHTTACLVGTRPCPVGTGVVEIGWLCWHRWLSDRGAS